MHGERERLKIRDKRRRKKNVVIIKRAEVGVDDSRDDSLEHGTREPWSKYRSRNVTYYSPRTISRDCKWGGRCDRKGLEFWGEWYCFGMGSVQQKLGLKSGLRFCEHR